MHGRTGFDAEPAGAEKASRLLRVTLSLSFLLTVVGWPFLMGKALDRLLLIPPIGRFFAEEQRYWIVIIGLDGLLVAAVSIGLLLAGSKTIIRCAGALSCVLVVFCGWFLFRYRGIGAEAGLVLFAGTGAAVVAGISAVIARPRKTG
jgi:hypothetical protein